jgi:hypothetical protein
MPPLDDAMNKQMGDRKLRQVCEEARNSVDRVLQSATRVLQTKIKVYRLVRRSVFGQDRLTTDPPSGNQFTFEDTNMSNVLMGTAQPNSSDGADGDYWLDYSTGMLYGKANGSWTQQGYWRSWQQNIGSNDAYLTGSPAGTSTASEPTLHIDGWGLSVAPSTGSPQAALGVHADGSVRIGQSTTHNTIIAANADGSVQIGQAGQSTNNWPVITANADGSVQIGITQPGRGESDGGQSGGGQPGGGQPPSGQPGGGQPPSGQPGGGQPPSGQPASNQPASYKAIISANTDGSVTISGNLNLTGVTALSSGSSSALSVDTKFGTIGLAPDYQESDFYRTKLSPALRILGETQILSAANTGKSFLKWDKFGAPTTTIRTVINTVILAQNLKMDSKVLDRVETS